MIADLSVSRLTSNVNITAQFFMFFLPIKLASLEIESGLTHPSITELVLYSGNRVCSNAALEKSRAETLG